MGGNRSRQYLPLLGKALIEWSIAPFLDAGGIDGVVVVLARGDGEFARLPIARHPQIVTVTATGSDSRNDSVLAGLETIRARTATLDTAVFVMIHDAARPCLTVDDIQTLRDDASDEHGGLLAVPVTETLKRVERERSTETLSRRETWRAQTPQLFRLDLLRSALSQPGFAAADAAEAMERARYRPRLVRGRESNIKVNNPEDVPLAEFWLSRQEYVR